MKWHSVGNVRIAVPTSEFNVAYIIEPYTSSVEEQRLRLLVIAEENREVLADYPAGDDELSEMEERAEKHLGESN